MAQVYGWTGKVLCVDLSTGVISHIDTLRYAPQLIGGVGVAAGIAWDELKPGTGPLDPGNLLMIMVGPLSGTLASGAGRVEVMGIAPQQHPPVFSRSGMGGHWGAELKFAGFDGVVIQGKADKPVYLWINDGQVEIKDAKDLWGTGTFATTAMLRAIHGPKTRIISCGQAGENLSRLAIIQTETGNAAGQGGFGAVMGSKKLKAIAVRGTGGVRIAQPGEFMDLCLNASREWLLPAPTGGGRPPELPYGPNYRTRKCGFCLSVCSHRLYHSVPGESTPALFGSAQQCYGYRGSPRGRMETRTITSDLGINGWDVAFGIIPWLQMCKQHGLVDKIAGLDIAVPDKPLQVLADTANYSAEFATTLLRMIAFREGEMGEALSDGACYAADRLFGGKGIPLLDRIYPRFCGQTEHWAGHWGPGGNVYWPFWLPPVLQWCMDTRDPANDSIHPWTTHAQRYFVEAGPMRGPFPAEKVRAVCAKVYGLPEVCDAKVEYDPPEARVIPALWHSYRGMIVNSMVQCDHEHTRVFSSLSEDGAADTAIMSKLYSACTGVQTSEQELDRSGERIWNLLRAIDVRNFGRDRRIDESTLNAFMYPGKDDGVVLDKAKFLKLMDKYYEMSGWNQTTGWPARARLEELGLKAVADGLEAASKLG